jgi:hypothetical protein
VRFLFYEKLGFNEKPQRFSFNEKLGFNEKPQRFGFNEKLGFNEINGLKSFFSKIRLSLIRNKYVTALSIKSAKAD